MVASASVRAEPRGAATNDLPGCAAGGAREAEVPRGRLLRPGCGPCRLHNPSRGPRSSTSGFPAPPGCAEPRDAVRCRRLPSEVRQPRPRRVQVGAVGRSQRRPRGHWEAGFPRERVLPSTDPCAALLLSAQAVSVAAAAAAAGARRGVGSWPFRGRSASDLRNWKRKGSILWVCWR